MGKTFEDEFMDIQSDLISLCLEFADGKADKIFAFAEISKYCLSFNAYFRHEGVIKHIAQMAQAMSQGYSYVDQFFDIGISDLKKILEVCERYNREIPAEMKMYYDVKTGRFNAEYRYEKDIPQSEDYYADKTFDEWEKELKARYEK